MPGSFKRIGSWTNRTLHRRLMVWSVAFWVISVTLMGLVFYSVGQTQMLNETRQRNVQLSSIFSRDINAEIGEIFNNARIFSQHLEMQGPDLNTQASAVLSLRLSSPQYRGVYYFDNNSQQLFDLTGSVDTLLTIKDTTELFARTSATVKDGVLSVYKATEAKNIYVSDVFFTSMDQVPELYIGMPLTFLSGEVRVVIFEVDMTDMWQKINNNTIEKTGIIYVVSRDGTIIAHPDPVRIGDPIPEEIAPLLSSQEGFAEYVEPYKQKPVIAAYSPVGGPTGWGIVVEQEISEIYAPILKTGSLIFGIWAALGVICTISIFFLIRNFTKPIKELTVTSQNIAQTGRLTRTGMETRPDEVGQLSVAFDQMIERLETSEGRLAQAAADERNRLARDLHDAVSQTLFSASLIAEVLPRLWERNPAEARKRLEEVRQLTRGALAEMRTLLLELRPASLIEAEIGLLLNQLGESINGRSRIPVTVTVEGECPVPNDVKIAVYRIAQEALNNVAKHSGAKSARVTLTCNTDNIQLTVADDGKGFDVNANSTKSLGLGIIRERAREINASLTIKSAEGQGTTISVSWKPLVS